MATPSVTLASLQDTTHDYYIHPNENPSLVLVSPILEGHNYHGWARSMSMALQMKNKFGFVDGSIPCPAGTDPMVQAWKRCNNLVLSWINHSVSHEIATSIIWIDSAATAWKDLKDRFSQGDSVRISQLHQDLYSMHQSDLSVTAYYTKMKILWDELCNFRPIPECQSSASCCVVSKTMKEYRENDCVLCFLRGLNDNYSVVRSQILLMDPLPSLPKIFSMIIQHERQLQSGILSQPPVMASQVSQSKPSFSTFNGRGKPSPANDYGRGRSSYQGSQARYQGSQARSSGGRFGAPRQCTHCGRTNHTIDTCFLIHGLPPDLKSKRVHNVTTDSSTVVPSYNNSPAQSHSAILGLSQEQIHGLLALLPQSNPTIPHSTNLVSSHNASTSSQAQVDDMSRYTWIKLVASKSDTISQLIGFVSYIKTQFGIDVKAVRSDN
ncbi:uncharacterized protein LOC124839860, partial [Vigna umbellata]|uniref:uncharacterized protein LOC124839860 n=1 Tax=Vigna umbellata TaxID=87088 RepID=UPI001F5E3F21